MMQLSRRLGRVGRACLQAAIMATIALSGRRCNDLTWTSAAVASNPRVETSSHRAAWGLRVSPRGESEERISRSEGRSDLLRGFLAASLSLALAAREAATARAEVPERQLIIDETKLVASSTEKYLDGLLRGLQRDTGLKVRVICPPAGIQGDRKAFAEYLRPINKDWGVDSSTLVIVAEERNKKQRNGQQGRPLPLMTIQAGFRLQERFQYRLTQDYLLGCADRFGFPTTVNERGTNESMKAATANVVAVMFSLVDDPNMRYLAPPSEEEVSTILKRHGL
ncbi:unnamed protein product [Polarella glacialis]|uniref:Uncharacterized protein n=1 Tax=Polarella glacialis TaxID=89957 RepID=A0A813F616_POLGL|nr:unnamed protein product [Polarella glacialis]